MHARHAHAAACYRMASALLAGWCLARTLVAKGSTPNLSSAHSRPSVAQVLAAWTILPVPRSPTFQLWAIFAVYCHYRCALHLEAWYMPEWYAQATALPPVGPFAPAIRVLNWLRLPQGRALLATLVAVAPVPRRGPIVLDT